MCKRRAHSYCPTCDTYRPADHYTTREEDPRHRCHGCGHLLVPAADALLGEGHAEALTALTGIAARALIGAGLLDGLADRASKAQHPDDVHAFHLARVLLREAAKL